jgi:hypothetical protein
LGEKSGATSAMAQKTTLGQSKKLVTGQTGSVIFALLQP